MTRERRDPSDAGRPNRMTGAVRMAAILAVVLTAPGIVLSSLSAAATRPCGAVTPDAPFAAALVLGGGMEEGRIAHRDSGARVGAAIDVFLADRAAALVLTGGGDPQGPSVGAAMALLAAEAGVPQAVLRVEGASRSTLENARLSLPLLPEGRILLVTSGFHAWRGWASLAWAGRAPDAICRSGRFDATSAGAIARSLAAEGLKWPANLARAAIWSASGPLGLRDRLPDWWLAKAATGPRIG